MPVRRPHALEAGLLLVVAAVPLAVLPPASMPFADAKPLFLTVGAALVVASGIAPDRRLLAAAVAFAVAAVAASLGGVDPLESLYGTGRPTGLVMLLPAAALIVVAPSIPDELLGRARVWLVRVAAIAAALAVAEHVWPELLDVVMEKEAFIGGPFGNTVILAGFLAAAIAAAFGPGRGGSWTEPTACFLLGSAFGVVGERSAFILPVVALVAVAALRRPGRRRLAAGAVALVAGMALWSFVPASEPVRERDVGTQFATTLGERQRLAVAAANLRATTERPLLGWGPSNSWSAFMSAGTSEEIRTATRTWGDAHNLVLQTAVTTGVLGLVALVWLGVAVGRRAARPLEERRWAAAGALTLLVVSMYEPLDPTLTPVLFLLAGAAAAPAIPIAATTPRTAAVGRVATVAVLVALVGVGALSAASSTLEEWGRTHFGSRWALETARSLAPWRLSTTEALALDLALDARAGDDAAAARARAIVADAVADHPDNPGVRLLAADVEILLRDEDAARAWIDRHVERFPGDTVSVADGRTAGATDTTFP